MKMNFKSYMVDQLQGYEYSLFRPMFIHDKQDMHKTSFWQVLVFDRLINI